MKSRLLSAVAVVFLSQSLACSKEEDERPSGLGDVAGVGDGDEVQPYSPGHGAGGAGGTTGADSSADPALEVDPCTVDQFIDSPSAFAALVAANCSVLEGDLVIGEEFRGNALESLAGLESIRTIDGDLKLTRLGVASLEGLEGLRELTGNFEMSYCEEVRDLAPLAEMARVGGDIELVYNLRLTQVATLASWGSGVVLGNLAINNNALLPQCEVDGALDALSVACREPADRECESLNSGSGGC